MTVSEAYLNLALSTYRHFDFYKDAIHDLNQWLPPLAETRILEAGCGSGSWVKMDGAYVVGVDISQHQLDRNKLLKERFCADLHVFERPEWEALFDYIVCWDVVEHLSNPKVVIAKFMKWLKPGGRLVIAFPNPDTLKGVVTKYSPYFIHQLFYKMASGTPFSASKTAQGPFPTVLSADLKFPQILRQFELAGVSIERFYSIESYQNRFVKRYAPVALINRLDRFFLGDLYPALHQNATDFIFVVKRS